MLALGFLAVILIFAFISTGPEQHYAGTLVDICLIFFVAGILSIESATGGWGLAVHFFRVPYMLDGP